MEKTFEDELSDLIAEARKRGVGTDEILLALESQGYALKEEAGDE